jgi:hypothetical protein
LGVSLHILAEGTRSDPRQLGFLIPDTPDHAEGILIVFCKKPKVPRGLHEEAKMGRQHGGSRRHTGGG